MRSYVCIVDNLASLDVALTTTMERTVTTTKKTGMTHSSLNFSGESEKATFENKREGVKIDIFNLFNCCRRLVSISFPN